MTALVTSLRMYSPSPSAANAWRALLAQVFAASGADVNFIEHAYPASIGSLWGTPGLCCDFMCGWPFFQGELRMQAIAVPVPSPPRYAHQPRYCSEFLVRANSGFRSLDETFGHRIGWMATNSQSGFIAPRAALARHSAAAPGALYRESRGPYVTPARTLDALRTNEVDVVALDSFWLDLLRRHDPAALADIATIAATPWSPIPLLVAAPDVDANVVARLRDRLVTLHEDPTYRPFLDDVVVERFLVPDLSAYAVQDAMARDAIERGYDAIR